MFMKRILYNLNITKQLVLKERKQTMSESISYNRKAPYNALDVARHIVNYSNDKKYWIDHLKLQKILYYCQVHFLCDFKEHSKCFKEKIEAWSWGPVVKEVYKEFKSYGSNFIPKIKQYTEEYEDNGLPYVSFVPFNVHETINDEDLSKIEYVVDVFKETPSINLMKKTHNEKPWIDAYKSYSKEITPELIRSSYKQYDN